MRLGLGVAEGSSAFIPVEAEDGKFEVRRVKYGKSVPKTLNGSLSFSDAEDLARERNQREGIPSQVWWAIAERLKNADV